MWTVASFRTPPGVDHPGVGEPLSSLRTRKGTASSSMPFHTNDIVAVRLIDVVLVRFRPPPEWFVLVSTEEMKM